MRNVSIITAFLLLALAGCNKQPSSPATLKEVIEVDGRQGVACDGEYYYVSGSTALYKYTLSRKLVLSNRGARIVLGMPKGFYDGYDREIHELYVFKPAEQ